MAWFHRSRTCGIGFGSGSAAAAAAAAAADGDGDCGEFAGGGDCEERARRRHVMGAGSD